VADIGQMKSLKKIFAEIAGLFVEDKLFALAIAIWIAIVASLAAAHAIAPQQGGIALFLGLAAILVASVVTAARNL
jgi:hypothetical protein